MERSFQLMDPAPAAIDSATIYISKNGQPVGPFDLRTIRNRIVIGDFTPGDLAWREGEPDWQPLSRLLSPDQPPPIPAPAAAAVVPAAVSALPVAVSAGAVVSAPIAFQMLPAAARALGPADSQHRKVSDYVHALIKNEHTVGIIHDFRTMDYKAEILPVNAHTLTLLKSDFVFWAVTVLAIVPLILVTLNDTQSQLTGFCLFFAAIWGLVFKKFIVEETGDWRLPLVSLFFTGFVGMPALLFIYKILPGFYMKLSDSEHAFPRLLGYIFQVGLCEEACKICPVLIYLFWKKRDARPLTVVLLGVFSGLGFSAFENLGYAQIQIARSAQLARQSGVEGLSVGVTEAMVNVLLRSMSLVFAHAVFSGIFSYFLALACINRRRVVALLLTGWVVAATVHGSYDWFWSVLTSAPAVVMALGFMLFYSYLTKLRLLMASAKQAVVVTEVVLSAETPEPVAVA